MTMPPPVLLQEHLGSREQIGQIGLHCIISTLIKKANIYIYLKLIIHVSGSGCGAGCGAECSGGLAKIQLWSENFWWTWAETVPTVETCSGLWTDCNDEQEYQQQQGSLINLPFPFPITDAQWIRNPCLQTGFHRTFPNHWRRANIYICSKYKRR